MNLYIQKGFIGGWRGSSSSVLETPRIPLAILGPLKCKFWGWSGIPLWGWELQEHTCSAHGPPTLHPVKCMWSWESKLLYYLLASGLVLLCCFQSVLWANYYPQTWSLKSIQKSSHLEVHWADLSATGSVGSEVNSRSRNGQMLQCQVREERFEAYITARNSILESILEVC